MLVSPLKIEYDTRIKKELMAERGYANVMQVPKIVKVCINVGVGEGKDNPKALESAVKTVTKIAGQKALITRAKKSVSNFKLRQGNPIGVMTTLRGHLMWHFLYKLVNVVLPRIRDFHGVSIKQFDGRGNYSIGLKDQLVFTEITFDEVDFIKGMQINIVTTAENDIEAAYLLKKLGMPFNDFTLIEKVN